MRLAARVFGLVLIALGVIAGVVAMDVPGQAVPGRVVLSLGWLAGGVYLVVERD